MKLARIFNWETMKPLEVREKGEPVEQNGRKTKTITKKKTKTITKKKTKTTAKKKTKTRAEGNLLNRREVLDRQCHPPPSSSCQSPSPQLP